MTTSWSYQLLDATDTPQAAYNATTTAALRTVSDLSGILSPPGSPLTSSLSAHGDQTISGLLTGTHTVNGTGNSSFIITSSGPTTTVTSTSTITDLVLPQHV